MAENSKIEWCDHTFNPWEGCQKVGSGCDHCYAETRNARFNGGKATNWGPGAPRRRTSAANWRKPLAWNRDASVFYAQHRRRQRVFCASLADVFDNQVPLEWLVDLLELIRTTPNLDWLLLTKRIGRVLTALDLAIRDVNVHQSGEALFQWLKGWKDGMPPANVWLGATVVNQEEADRDIPKLLATPAAKRFLSMEPLLGQVRLRWDWVSGGRPAGGGPACDLSTPWKEPEPEPKVDWVIVGGESGPGARPMHPDWVRSLRDQCQAAGVPLLFKQWGEWAPFERTPEKHARITMPGQCGDLYAWPDGTKDGWRDGAISQRVGKKAAGRLLDGREWNEVPQ